MKTFAVPIKTFCTVFLIPIYLFSQSLLTDSSATYSYKNEDFKLGMYEGTNIMPAEHLADGLEIAKEMRKMSKINIVVIGHSVPYTTFNGWNWANAKTSFNLAANTNFVCGSISAKMAWDWVNEYKGGTVKTVGGINAADVNVLAVQLTWAPFGGPDSYEKNTALSKKVDSMSHDLARLAQGAKKSFPNLKMILMQADPWQNNHEPYHAYHEWFFSRQVMLNQIKGDPSLSYKGADAKTVWIGMGGYWWKPNASSSYYTDCCHISAAGATYYREVWVKSLLEDPVVGYWLAKDPPIVNVENTLNSLSRVSKFHGTVTKTGVGAFFSLPNVSLVSIGLFSVDGQALIPMTERLCQAGPNSLLLNAGCPIAPGAYILRLNDGTTDYSLRVTTMDK
jgi:hypothetical protein